MYTSADIANSPGPLGPVSSYDYAAAPIAILFFLGFFALVIGILVLKGFALWRAARNGHKGWFVAMLVVNLMGILEVIYLLTAGKNAPPAGPVATAPTPAPSPTPPEPPKSPVPPMN